MNANIQKKPIRLWAGVIIVLIQWLFRFVVPLFVQGDMIIQIAVLIGFLGGIAVMVWWAFFSRAERFDRFGAIVLMIIALITTAQFLDISIKTAMQGLMFTFYSLPVLSLAFVLSVLISQKLSKVAGRVVIASAILLSSGFWILLRTDGMDGSAGNYFSWRFAKTAEEKFLDQLENEPMVKPPALTEKKTTIDWPGFRGKNRDSIVHGLQINSDWTSSRPVEMWRRPVGPACSSFAAHGNVFYTQEQRGEFETVSCYELSTGKPVWKHQDKARFYDSHAGAGPRSTPTIDNGRVYTLGGTGILNVLNAADGKLIWSRNAATDAGVKVRTWGFSSSPLIVKDIVLVALAGKIAAYDTATGKPMWSGPDGKRGYSSPHLMTICGVPQVLLMSESGATSFEPKSGKQLWDYSWKAEDRILQPALIGDSDLLLTEETKGLRRISISHTKDEWSVKEVWTSSEMKLNFNDFIVRKGFAYGFDGANIACIDIKDGKCKWKGEKYRGFILLLADEDLLIVLSEKGELALVEAVPEKFKELAKFQAITGKTWNHPALAGDTLLVRNSKEMAAYRLATAEKKR